MSENVNTESGNTGDGERSESKATRPRFFILEPNTRKVILEIRGKPQFQLRSPQGLAEDCGLTDAQVMAAIAEAGQLGLMAAATGSKKRTMFGLTRAGKYAIV